MKWEKLRQKVLDKFYPSRQELEELETLYSDISTFIESEYGLETFFAGSAGRETCVADDKDIDVFVLFPEDTERSKLEDLGLEIGENVFESFDGEFEVEYAEHPYTKGGIQGHEVEVVPCVDTSPQDIRSAVDRSPHHAEWVDDNLSESQKKDVVILKSFLKSQGLYGSSLKNRGFSGYLCEVLIAYAESFDDLVQDASSWREDKVIDVESHHDHLPQRLEKKFSQSSLKVVDPVDEERNVASVLTSENYAKFVYSCWQFSKNPGMNFFVKKDLDLDKFRLKQELDDRGEFIVMELDRISEPEDIVYPQMRKAMSRFEDVLRKRDFRLYNTGFHIGSKIRIFFETSSSERKINLKRGPKPFHNEAHVSEFTSKYENTFIRNERICTKIEREYTHPKDLLHDFITQDKPGLEQDGIPGNVADKLVDASFVKPMTEDEEWLKFLYKRLRLEQ
jgi:CCA-adding enzyme